MNFVSKLQEALRLLKEIAQSTSPDDVADKFERLVFILNTTPEIAGFFFTVDPITDYFPIQDFVYSPQSDSFIYPDRDYSIPRSDIIYTVVPTVGFANIPPFRSGNVLDYIRGVLLSVAPDLSPVIGEGISSAEEHIINILSAFYQYFADQIEYVQSQFFPETASGVFLLQLASLYGTYPSPPSPDYCLMRPSMDIDETITPSLADQISNAISSFVSEKISVAASAIRGLPSTITLGDLASYNAVVAALTSISSFFDTLRSGNEFNITARVKGNMELFIEFSPDTFPRVNLQSISPGSGYIFQINSTVSLKYRIKIDQFTTKSIEVREQTSSLSQIIPVLLPDVAGNITVEIFDISISMKASPAFSLEGFGVRPGSRSTVVSGVSYEYIPPVDFQSIRVEPKTIINPYAPETNVLESSYVIPIWDPINEQTVLKFVVRDLSNVPVTVFYDEIVPIEENAVYTNPVQINRSQFSGDVSFSLNHPVFRDTETVATYVQGLIYSAPIFPVSLSIDASDEFTTPLTTSMDFQVFEVKKGWIGDTLPILRSGDIINRGVLREGDIISLLQRFLPVIVSVDMVAVRPPAPELPT